MKKRTKVILGIVIGMLFAYSVIATLGIRSVINELEQKTTDYDILEKNYFELQSKYYELVFDNAIK